MQDDRPLIVMLEDDHERIARFAAVLSRSFRFLYWRTAHDFIANFPNIPKPQPGKIVNQAADARCSCVGAGTSETV